MSTSLFSLEGRRALVTGAGRGIGRAIALGLADAGAELTLAGRPGAQEETHALVREQGGSAHVVDLDLGSRTDTLGVGARLAAGDPFDVVVNNAGTIERHDTIDLPADSWQRVLDVNLSHLFLLTQQLARPMLERGHGKIINLASLLSFQGGIRVASYAASKHAVAGLTRALANEWAGQGLQVNAIAPGYIATDNTAALRADPDRHAQISARIPAGRWGSADDLVGATVFLASAASDYVNGHVLVVDGGWMAR